ncbi:unnamed protein product [Cunninghamella blakesleeana]
MADEVDIFSNFYFRKPPIITYKRKPTYSGFTSTNNTNATTTINSHSFNDYSTNTIKRTNYIEKNSQGKENIKNDITTATTLLKNNKSSFNIPTKTPVPKKDVFDFPEEDSNNAQVEIRVATTFHKNKQQQQQQQYCQPTSNNNKRTIEKVTNGNGLQYKKVALTKPRRPTFSRTKSAPQDLRSTYSNSVNTIISSSPPSILNYHHHNNNNNNNKTGSFVLPSSSLPPLSNNYKKQQPQHKRSLVSRLKSADGVCNNESLSSNGLRLYDTINEDDHLHSENNHDDHDDDDIFSNRQKNQKRLGNESILSQIPTMNHGQNIEKDINELLRSELGEEFINAFNNPSDLLLDLSNELFNNNDDVVVDSKLQEEEEEKQKSRYIPENTIRASVTYKRSHHQHSRKDDIDSELERQIHELLS